MALFDFLRKSKTPEVKETVSVPLTEKSVDVPANKPHTIDWIETHVVPKLCGANYIELYKSVPEVFFPIDYIASRIAGAKFELKRVEDDSIVFNNEKVNKFLDQPNCMLKFREMVYQHFVYKLATGNAFMRAASGSLSSSINRRWRWCDNYWELPANYISVNPMRGLIPLYGIASKEELIESYELKYGIYAGSMRISPNEVWHDRDGAPQFFINDKFSCSESRLRSQSKPISNLIAVYEARNVIYVKRGGLGYIISQKSDATGSVALTDKEKESIISQVDGRYGVTGNRMPYGISDVPIGFVRTNLSISDLQPFDETLQDAITIAGAYGIPSVLVPRKDQSTFSNQATAEKSVYCSQIIPMAKKFIADLTAFLGLEEDGMYLDVNFGDVDCMQQGLKEAEEVKKLISERCRSNFLSGIITLNDWRAQIGESKIEKPMFDKILFDMSDEEIELVNRVLNTKSVENGRNQEPSVQNEGQ